MVAKKNTVDSKTPEQPVRRGSIDGVRHKPGTSRTLMRRAVKKPAPSTAKQVKKQTPLTPAKSKVTVTPVVAPKASLTRVKPERQVRASQTGLSPRVAHFAQNTVPAAVQKTIEVLQQPVSMPFAETASEIQRSTVDIFEQALARATSHEQPAPPLPLKKRHRAAKALKERMSWIVLVAAVLVVLLGVWGYRSSQSVKLQLAGQKAGFSAVMPDYTPSGFTLTTIDGKPGMVTMTYEEMSAANGQGRRYTIVQKQSHWDSLSLRDTLQLANGDSAISTINAGGRQVYVYGQNQAAWVSGGVLYQILGGGTLTTEQIQKIASTL